MAGDPRTSDGPAPGDALVASGHAAADEDEGSFEGWEPVVGGATRLEDVVERAFDYRGDVTVVRRDGTELTGYLFNRDAEVAERFVQMFDRAGDGPFTIRYAEIQTIRFTGKDTAAGKSYEAWRRRKTERLPAPTASDSARGA